ncbi:hypothetical protein GH714_019210 [Hevea brasiliensis]|uniref:Retrotransposon gag domain-containing protein n=1 Tax=Hevea brasiliensis TaxID=3981 RepID=A0A6A6MUN1_HEVBR|nr:hypothetical protein GH714_019138 [Hevea brasiliensis]KAF2317268.1 hypothetical protein GH714_019210 [Hevea brasiliensis]
MGPPTESASQGTLGVTGFSKDAKNLLITISMWDVEDRQQKDSHGQKNIRVYSRRFKRGTNGKEIHMPKTRMEGRMEQVERKVSTIEEAINAMRLDQEQRFSRMENMIAAMAKDKTTIVVGETSNLSTQTTLQGDTSTVKPTAITLLFEDAGTVAKKVDMPSFDGSDPIGWLARTHQYFEIHGVQNELKVSLALVSMEGALLHWLRWLRQRNPQLTWEQLQEELVQRYGDDLAENPYEHIATEKQTRTVAEYVDEFVARASQVPEMSDKQCLGYFLSGLKEDISVRLWSYDTVDLYRTIKLAREVEREH